MAEKGLRNILWIRRNGNNNRTKNRKQSITEHFKSKNKNKMNKYESKISGLTTNKDDKEQERTRRT